jgi:phosphonate transport system permease protein
MTASAPPANPPVARPARPSRSPWLPVALVFVVAATWWAAAGIGFDLVELFTSLGRANRILSDAFPPNWGFLDETLRPLIETFQMAVIATVIGCGVGLPVAMLASSVSNPNALVLWIDRSVLAVVRAVPDIMYALIFVSALSVGPLPGVLALILFNIGVIGKLLSETIDGIDPGPLEAATAAGGSRHLVNRWAVLPQLLPNYVAYALYSFELNIRASAVIGLVGAGGLGQLLQTQRRFFLYDNQLMIIVELFALVVVIEMISVWLRRRLV